jgi:MFS family permease
VTGRRADAARWPGALAIAAAPMTVLGLVLGLLIVDFDAESFRDPDVVLALGREAAGTLRTSYLLVMLGSYLLLVPLAVALWSRLGPRRDATWATALVAGLAYLGLGAAGASILAAVWPALIEQYAASGADQGAVRVAFVTATRIAEDGLQGAVQNVAGGLWWTLVGLRLREAGHGKLGWLTLVLGAASTVNALGSLLAAEALTLPGLTLTVLLAPVWSIAVGVTVVRDRLTAAPPAEEPLTDPRNLTRS